MEAYIEQLIKMINLTENRPIKEVVYEGLRKAIILGIIPVGERVNQKVLSDYMNISRTPIRNSVEALKAEGLLEEIPNYGVVVKKVTVADVEEIFKLRINLETLAALTAMDVMTDEDLAEMDELLKKTIESNNNYEVTKTIAYFSEYNEKLLNFARMPRLVIVVNQLKEYLARFRDISLEGYERRTKALFEHILIVHCIKMKEKQLVTKVIEDHLSFAKDFIIERVLESEKPLPSNDLEAKTNEFILSFISSRAVKALINEATLTPKPGLVDINNSGSHNDMDLPLFFRSANSFYNGFLQYILCGYHHRGNMDELMKKIRIIGIENELVMLENTANVNTHKGANFSFGVLLSAIGVYLSKEDLKTFEHFTYTDIIACFEITKEITAKIITNDFANIKNKTNLSHGEKMYMEYGITGIRGEAASGYQTITKTILPKMIELQKTDKTKKLIFLELLFELMAITDDSNVLHRGGMEKLNYIKKIAKNFLPNFSELSEQEIINEVAKLDREFIKKNISPGGAADLLAITIFIDDLLQATFNEQVM